MVAPRPGGDPPPLEKWERIEAMRALFQFVADLRLLEADEAWSRLGRLTEAQRRWVLGALERWDGTGLPPWE